MNWDLLITSISNNVTEEDVRERIYADLILSELENDIELDIKQDILEIDPVFEKIYNDYARWIEMEPDDDRDWDNQGLTEF